MGTEQGDEDEAPASQPTDTPAPARARLKANAELGRRFAEALEEPESHQLGVCGKLRINWRTHMRWMAQEIDPADDPDLAEYQALVLEALDKQRRRDLEDAQDKLDNCHPAKASAQFNMSTFRHKGRFARFYEEPAKHEVQLTGKDGGPMQVESNAKVTLAEKLDEFSKRITPKPGDGAGS